MSVQAARQRIHEAMKALVDLPCGGIGSDGYTLDELNQHVEETFGPLEGDSTFHQGTLAFRLLELAMTELEGHI